MSGITDMPQKEPGISTSHKVPGPRPTAYCGLLPTCIKKEILNCSDNGEDKDTSIP